MYLFLRHAETAKSESKEWHGGTSDPPLSPKGRKHAFIAAERLCDLNHKIALVVTSDFCRAIETATVFAGVLNCDIDSNPLLRERHLGEWEGLSQSEIERRWPGSIEDWRMGRIGGPPGGETDDEVVMRVRSALSGYGVKGKGLTLIISHAGLLRGLLAWNGMPDEEIPPLGGRWLTFTEETGQISIGNGTSL
jgi:glucosyl-3-phosphoglycerate phosphatase